MAVFLVIMWIIFEITASMFVSWLCLIFLCCLFWCLCVGLSYLPQECLILRTKKKLARIDNVVLLVLLLLFGGGRLFILFSCFCFFSQMAFLRNYYNYPNQLHKVSKQYNNILNIFIAVGIVQNNSTSFTIIRVGILRISFRVLC